MPNIKSDALLIGCSDGRTKKPRGMRDEYFVNIIKFPGGILFPDFCAHSLPGREQTFEMSEPMDVEIKKRIQALMKTMTPETSLIIGEMVLLLTIKTMIDLKRPKKTVLGYHTYCGVAEVIGLNEFQIQAKHQYWQHFLKSCYPNMDVQILKETHSACGEHHHGHEEVAIMSAVA